MMLRHLKNYAEEKVESYLIHEVKLIPDVQAFKYSLLK